MAEIYDNLDAPSLIKKATPEPVSNSLKTFGSSDGAAIGTPPEMQILDQENLLAEGIAPGFYIYLYEMNTLHRDTLQNMQFNRAPTYLKHLIVLPVPKNGLDYDERHNWEERAGLAGSLGEAIMAEIGQWMADGGPILPSIVSRFFQNDMPNDLVSLQYKQPELRSFNFDWEFIPRSQGEALEIATIIRTLRGAAMPSQRNGGGTDAMFKAIPYFARIEVNQSNNARNLFFTDFAVIENVKISYKGDDSAFNTFHDGNPIRFNISLGIKELFRPDRESIAQEASTVRSHKSQLQYGQADLQGKVDHIKSGGSGGL